MIEPDIDLTDDEDKRGKMEAGGIEPRTLELETALKQALTHLGKEGLVSCLVLLCQHPSIVRLVEAWAHIPDHCKRHILRAVNEGCEY